MTPFFSVVVPLYNKERYVTRCIESVLEQSFADFELIVVDDGSTDGSASLVRAYDDDRIRVVSQDNQGPGAARNLGIDSSCGQWVSFLDADDAWRICHLQELRGVIEYAPQAGIVATKAKKVDANAKVNLKYCPEINESVNEVDYFLSAAKEPFFIHSSTAAIKRTVFEQVGQFKPQYHNEDLDMWARVCLQYPCFVSAKQTAFYFNRTGGLTEFPKTRTQGRRSVTRARDVSPFIAMLLDEMDKMSLGDNRSFSIAQYINFNISNCVRGHFVNGRIVEAKMFGHLYLEPILGEARVWKHFLRMPRVVLETVSNGRRTLRWAYRKTQNFFD